MMQHISRAPDNSIIARVLDTGHVVILEQGLHEDWASAQADPALVAYDEQPQAPEVPQTVTRFQARAALSRAGLFVTVNDMMMALPEDNEQRLAWTDALTFERTSPTLQSLSTALGLTSQDLDAMFAAAVQIEA
jgi:hypothetical protein